MVSSPPEVTTKLKHTIDIGNSKSSSFIEAQMADTKSRIDLIPWDFNSEEHQQRMYLQRLACGWRSDEIQRWVELGKSGQKTLYWIVSSSMIHRRMHTRISKHESTGPGRRSCRQGVAELSAYLRASTGTQRRLISPRPSNQTPTTLSDAHHLGVCPNYRHSPHPLATATHTQQSRLRPHRTRRARPTTRGKRPPETHRRRNRLGRRSLHLLVPPALRLRA